MFFKKWAIVLSLGLLSSVSAVEEQDSFFDPEKCTPFAGAEASAQECDEGESVGKPDEGKLLEQQKARFLEGKIIYKTPAGKILNLHVKALSDPTNGEFDLSGFGEVECVNGKTGVSRTIKIKDVLSIRTGYPHKDGIPCRK